MQLYTWNISALKDIPGLPQWVETDMRHPAWQDALLEKEVYLRVMTRQKDILPSCRSVHLKLEYDGAVYLFKARTSRCKFCLKDFAKYRYTTSNVSCGQCRRRRKVEGQRYGRNYDRLLRDTCVHCGQSFTPQRKSALFCSGKCRVAEYRKRKELGDDYVAPSPLKHSWEDRFLLITQRKRGEWY